MELGRDFNFALADSRQAIITSTKSQLFNQVLPNDRFRAVADYPPGKVVCLPHFNHIATVRWRAQNLSESLTFTSRHMYRLAAEIHQTREF